MSKQHQPSIASELFGLALTGEILDVRIIGLVWLAIGWAVAR